MKKTEKHKQDFMLQAMHRVNDYLQNRWVILAVLIVLFTLAFIPRTYRIDNPVADWHSWRQADTAAVTRNFVKEGYTPLFPKFDSFNSLNEGNLPNPDRFFFAEFPIYNSIVYFFYSLFGVNEVYARLVSIFFSSLTAVVLFLLVRRYSTNVVALTSALFFALNPYNIYYGRVIMPDPLHVFFGVLTLYLVSIWVEKKTIIWPILAGITMTICILTKPYGLVLGLPILYLLIQAYGLTVYKQFSIYLFAVITLLPFFAWRLHIQNYPEGMFGTAWLFNQGDIRFTGAYFRWMIYDRLNRLILATGGFVLFCIGAISSFTKKEAWFYGTWLAGIGIFFVVIAKGNVTHDYYQLPIVPIASIFMAKAVEFLLTLSRPFIQRTAIISITGILVLLMIAFGWYEVRGFFNINRPEIVEVGKYIDENLPEDVKVIAPYMSDPAFLYQTNRYGWTIGGGNIAGYREKEGATHLAVVNFDEDVNYWIDRCQIVAEDPDRWVLVDLRQCQIDDNATDSADLENAQ